MCHILFFPQIHLYSVFDLGKLGGILTILFFTENIFCFLCEFVIIFREANILPCQYRIRATHKRVCSNSRCKNCFLHLVEGSILGITKLVSVFRTGLDVVLQTNTVQLLGKFLMFSVLAVGTLLPFFLFFSAQFLLGSNTYCMHRENFLVPLH